MILPENRHPPTDQVRGHPFPDHALGHDVDFVATPHHLESLQLQLGIAHAMAGLEVVFVAVPRADEVHLVGKGLALVGAIRRDDIDHLVDHDAFASRSAGMDAVVAVSEVAAALMKYADLVLTGRNDA